MGKCELRREDGRNVLALSGDFTVAEAADLKGSLLEALAAGPDLAVDLGGVEKVDLTFLQLLRAAHISLQQRGKALDCPGGIPPAVAETADRAGFLIGATDHIFWKRGK
ncbi:MAG TPA: STAS domain-containing protein [Spirochaetales bacterium]|nr:STAS domain-containing protein [Spirochaetales bacterium]